MNTSEIINYINENYHCYKLPATVEAEWDVVQEYFEKGKSICVRIDEEKKELRFQINLGDDFEYISGEHFSKVYKFKSLDKLAQKLYPNVSDFQTKRYKVVMGDDTIFEGDNTLVDIKQMVEPIRMENPDKCVSVLYDFYTEDDKEYNASFIGNVTWNTQIENYPYYGADTEAGKVIMDEALRIYNEKYPLSK